MKHASDRRDGLKGLRIGKSSLGGQSVFQLSYFGSSLNTEEEKRMKQEIRILGIAGSLRQDSYNRAALRAAQRLVPQGSRLDIFDLAGIPIFNQDDEKNLPERVADLKTAVRS